MNNKKLKLCEKINDAAAKTSMLAIFVTGVPALLSIVTPIPTAIALGAYGVSNLVFTGSLICGVKIEDAKRKRKIPNTELTRNK